MIKRKLRESEGNLGAALNRAKRPETAGDLHKKAYGDLKKKNDGEFDVLTDGHGELRKIKLAAFNRCLAK